jgi:hypothetical protein
MIDRMKTDQEILEEIAREFVEGWRRAHSVVGDKVSRHYPRPKVITNDNLAQMCVDFLAYLRERGNDR